MDGRRLTDPKKPQKLKYRAFAWINGKNGAEIIEADNLKTIFDKYVKEDIIELSIMSKSPKKCKQSGKQLENRC